MSIFAVTFRIDEQGEQGSRRKSIAACCRQEAVGPVRAEAASFFVLESSKTSTELAHSIYLKSLLHASRDKMLVVDLVTKDYMVIGDLDDSAIAALMAEIDKRSTPTATRQAQA
ncbi:MAG TPA: hypothetical protein VL418_10755 [Devosiaceae bacterium]|jgi:hypothetical protein|nr:hypothetical protein [Devosiaceae bacterium]